MKQRSRGEGSFFQRPDGLWVGRVTLPNGERKQVTAKKKGEAMRKWGELKRSIQNGLPVVSARLTLGEFLETWLEDCVRPRGTFNTYRGYKSVVYVHLIPSLGCKPLTQLHQTHVQHMLASLATKLKPTTISRIHFTLRAALHYAATNDLVQRNVAALVNPASTRREEVVPLSAEDVQRLLRAVRGKPIEPVIVVAMSTGMRFSEILGLTWEDVLFDEGRIDLRYQMQWIKGQGMVSRDLKTKGSRRSIDLPGLTIRVLREHRKQQIERRIASSTWLGNLVFCRDNGLPMTPTVVRNQFKKVVADIGLPATRFHDMRHTVVSLLLAEGIPLHDVSKIMGHSGMQVTADVYGHITPERRREAADRMSAALERSS